MAKLKVKDGAEECCQAMDSISDMLVATLKQAKTFQKSVNEMSWSGESRDHFVILLDLIIQYHADLSNAGEALITCFTEMYENIEDYDGLSAVQKLEGIST